MLYKPKSKMAELAEEFKKRDEKPEMNIVSAVLEYFNMHYVGFKILLLEHCHNE